MAFKATITSIKGTAWCKAATWALRLMVGGVFIFSGFVKGIDPWGTCYKITDYLNAMGLQQWSGTALFGAAALAAIEFVLGVCLAAGAYRRSAPVLALLMLLALTPVTLWSAVTGAVPDCGCFGDAVHLGAWATFFKNVALLVATVWLLVFNKSVRGLYGPAVQWVVVALSFAFIMAVGYYGYFTQPLIDYRPYPEGARLVADEAMSDSEGEDDFIFVYKKDGQEHEFTIDSLPDEGEGWEYVTRYHAKRPRGKVIVQDGEGNGIAILDEDGTDVTVDVLGENRRMVLLLFPDLPDVGIVHSFALNELNDAALVADADVVGLTPATPEQVEQWKDLSMAAYPIYTMDDSELKMLARGNPAVIYLEDGVIKWKRTLASLDSVDPAAELSDMGSDYNAPGTLRSLWIIYLLAMLALLLINRAHVAVGSIWRRLRSNNDAETSETAKEINQQQEL